MHTLTKRLAAIVAGLAVSMLPLVASAHQHAVYEIGGHEYEFVVGSLNEPIAVDDKTGVEFHATRNGMPLSGLEETLQVELRAGSKTKVFSLTPTYNVPGSYYAKYYPTVATTISYRLFGEIDGTPVDLTFTCRAEGGAAANEGEKDISAEVRQISKTGGFGCPTERTVLGFPEDSASIVSVADTAHGTRSIAIAGLALSAIALAIAGASLRRRS